MTLIESYYLSNKTNENRIEIKKEKLHFNKLEQTLTKTKKKTDTSADEVLGKLERLFRVQIVQSVKYQRWIPKNHTELTTISVSPAPGYLMFSGLCSVLQLCESNNT